MSLCSVALSSFEEHEAKLAGSQMVRTAIRNQVLNLSNLIIVSVLYLKSATKLLILPLFFVSLQPTLQYFKRFLRLQDFKHKAAMKDVSLRHLSLT